MGSGLGPGARDMVLGYGLSLAHRCPAASCQLPRACRAEASAKPRPGAERVPTAQPQFLFLPCHIYLRRLFSQTATFCPSRFENCSSQGDFGVHFRTSLKESGVGLLGTLSTVSYWRREMRICSQAAELQPGPVPAAVQTQ